MGPIKKVKAGEIFEGNTYLHLVIWDRFSETSNTRGLTLTNELVQKFDLVMPMLRPLGRSPQNYLEDSKTEFRKPPPNRFCQKIPSAPLLDNNHTGHCEQWIQVADSIENHLMDFLEKHINRKDIIFGVFLNRENPVWQPLGDSMKKCDYAMARDGLGTKILCDIGEKQVSAFLKLIWYQSSVVIDEWVSKQTTNPWIDPLSQKDILCDLMAKIFADINPNEYGIPCSFESIDPSAFGVAHMAAFAINTITMVLHVYRIEQYFGNSNVTQPHAYASRDEFLQAFRN